MKKRIVSMALVLCMVLSVLAPGCLFATGDTVAFAAVNGAAGKNSSFEFGGSVLKGGQETNIYFGTYQQKKPCR